MMPFQIHLLWLRDEIQVQKQGRSAWATEKSNSTHLLDPDLRGSALMLICRFGSRRKNVTLELSLSVGETAAF
jgi:hypothetical protein